jgi:outer membrane protein OmpA-like peptidoglycan-associated protein
VALGFSSSPDATASGTSGGKVEFDQSTMGSAVVGYDYGANWRAEVEVSRRAAGLSSVAAVPASGEALATSLMVNALYDLDVDGVVKPYVGVGVGMADVNIKNGTPFGGSTINNSDSVGAAQAIVGASYAVSNVVDVFGDYRYYKTANADFRTAAGTSTSMNFSAHSAMVGLRYNFGWTTSTGPSQADAASAKESGTAQLLQNEPKESPLTQPKSLEPPAPQVAQVEPVVEDVAPVLEQRPLPEAYKVFFKLNKAEVTPEGHKIIEQVVENAKAMKLSRIELTGHTDSSGDEKYNLDLSKRRAEAVRTAFVALDFKESEILILAKGETSPVVMTPDGKYEPKNRRVEIVLP